MELNRVLKYIIIIIIIIIINSGPHFRHHPRLL